MASVILCPQEILTLIFFADGAHGAEGTAVQWRGRARAQRVKVRRSAVTRCKA